MLFSKGTLRESVSLSAQSFFLVYFLFLVFNKTCLIFFPVILLMQMASRKRKSSTSRSQEPYDTTRFVFEVAWEHYEQNVHARNIFPERNVDLYLTQYDEFRKELEMRRWHKALTRQPDGRTDVALVKEFYANLFDPEDKSPRQVRVWGKLIKFDPATLNTFLETPVVLEPGERYSTYSRFCHSHPDPQELASKLCIPGRGFVLNTEGAPWKLLRKDLTTLAQTWSVLSYSNLTSTSHTSNLNMDRARLVYRLVMKIDMDVDSIISGQIRRWPNPTPPCSDFLHSSLHYASPGELFLIH